MSQKIYIFVGVQGSGKGTQAKTISKELGMCHISTGDLFRELTGELKTEVDSYMNAGKLIPNELVIEILEERIEKDDCKKGIILDGFPRNLEQANALDKKLKVDKVVEIQISDKESLKRLSGRFTCENCKEGYNIYTAPKPKQNGICDKCGGKLVQRADDNPEAIKKRIEDYHNQTEPILNHYKDKVIKIDGEQTIEAINKELLEKLK